MQRFVLSRFQFFAFKTPRTRSMVGGAKRVSLSLSSPSLSLVRVFPSHKGSQPFFLIRQRRHRIFPTALSTRVNNNARKKHAREHCYLASFLLSLSFFYNITNAAQRTLQTSCNPLSSPPPFLPRNLISFRSTF